MKALSLIVFVAGLALADFASAQAPRPRPQRVDPLTSSIYGRVTTADTGAPIRGAEIRLAIDGRFNRLATTNNEGRYEVRNLPAGSYKVTISKSGFISLEYGQRRPFETASTITIKEGESAAGNVALMRGGAIFGRIVDASGDPLIGTRVQVLRVRVESGRRRLLAVGAGDQTDDTGAFRLYGLPPGEYYVSASTGLIDAVKRDPPVYYPGTLNFTEAQPITLTAGAEASADFQIAETGRSATISGVVFNSGGAPAAGAMVNLASDTLSLNPGSQAMFMLHADAAPDGSFTIPNVPPGSYTLTAQLMRQFEAGMIAAQRDAIRVQTQGGLPPPVFEAPETAAMPLVVTSDLSGISLSTRNGGRVSGRFVADTGVTQPLPNGLQISLRSLTPNNMLITFNGGNDTGDVHLTGSSGPARFQVNGVPEGWAVKAILLDGEDVTDEPFEMAGKAGTFRVVMTDRVTSVTGTVQSTSEIRDHNVVVFSDDATKWTSPSRFVRAIRADAEGRFRITGLPPGERYLAAAIDYLEDGEEQNGQLLERLRSRATSFSLREGEQRSIQLDLHGR